MVDVIVELAVGMIIILCLVVIIVVAIYFWRKKKSVVLTIERDYRNPGASKTVFYAIYNSNFKQYDLFKNIFSFKPVRGLANVDLKAYTDAFGRVKAVRGVTGKPGDDMIVPVGLALNSQAAANEYAQTMSDGITARFQHVSLVHARVKGVDLDKLEKKELAKLIQITGLGIDALKKIQLMKDEDVKKLSEKEISETLKTTFTPEWVMQTLGIRTVEDANIITIPQKNAIASIGSRANEFIHDHAGWWEKNAGIFIGIMCMIMLAVSIVILFYGASQYLSQIPTIVQNTVQSSTQGALNAYGINLSNVVPKA